MQQNNTLLTTKEASVLLNCSESKLEKDRMGRKGASFIKMGHAVRYDKKDIQDYLERQKTHIN